MDRVDNCWGDRIDRGCWGLFSKGRYRSNKRNTHSALNYFHWLRHHSDRLDQDFPQLLQLICTHPRPSQGLHSLGSQKRKSFKGHEQARAALPRPSYGCERPSAFLCLPSEKLPV